MHLRAGAHGQHHPRPRWSPCAVVFKLPSGRKSQMSVARLHAHLLDWLRASIKTPPSQMLEIVYLCYDGCADLIGSDQIMAIQQI